MATFCLRFQKQGERVLLRCERAMAELHLIGQIIGGTEFAEKSICCRWQLSSGTVNQLYFSFMKAVTSL